MDTPTSIKRIVCSTSLYYYYTWIYKARKFSNDTESEALAVTGGQHGKGVDWLFEKMSLQTAFKGDIKR